MKITRTTITRALGKSAPFHAWRMLGLLSLYLQVLDQTGDYDVATEILKHQTKHEGGFALKYDKDKRPSALVFLDKSEVYYAPIKRSTLANLVDYLLKVYAKEEDEK